MVDNNATKLLGLTENDFSVYTAYLKYGESSPAVLARLIHMDKSSAYRAVELLAKKGLLIKNPKNRNTTYQAAPPDTLSEIYTSQKSQLDLLIEDLKKQQNGSGRSTYTVVEKGIEALRNRMSESLGTREKLIREKFSDKFRFFDDKTHNRFVINFAKERTKHQIRINVLEDWDWKVDNRFEDIMIDQSKYLKEIRKIPQDAIFAENSLRIWDDTINIVSEDENREFIIITIRDQYVSRMLKTMFDFIWTRSSPVC
jgi:sugar-specific transcriptional regulator TrmB